MFTKAERRVCFWYRSRPLDGKIYTLEATNWWRTLNVGYWILRYETLRVSAVLIYNQEYHVLRPTCRPQPIITNNFFAGAKAKRGWEEGVKITKSIGIKGMTKTVRMTYR